MSYSPKGSPKASPKNILRAAKCDVDFRPTCDTIETTRREEEDPILRILDAVQDIKQAQRRSDARLGEVMDRLYMIEKQHQRSTEAGMTNAQAKFKQLLGNNQQQQQQRAKRQGGIENLRRKAGLTQHLCKLGGMGMAMPPTDGAKKPPSIPIPAVMLATKSRTRAAQKQQQQQQPQKSPSDSQSHIEPESPVDDTPSARRWEMISKSIIPATKVTDTATPPDEGECTLNQPDDPVELNRKTGGTSERLKKKYDQANDTKAAQPEENNDVTSLPETQAKSTDDGSVCATKKEKGDDKDKKKNAVRNPMKERIKLDESLFPDGYVKITADLLSLIAILSETLFVTWMISINYQQTPVSYVIIVLLLLPFHLFWIYTNFRTSFLRGWILTDQVHAIRRKYLSTWFCYDLIVCLPWDVVFAAFSFTGFKACTALRLLPLVRVPWLLERSNPVQDKPVWVQVVVSMFWSIIILHLATCSWLFIGTHADQGFDSDEEMEKSRFRQYIAALYWACATVSSTGYGDISGVSNGARVLASAWMWIGVLVIVFFSSKVTQWMVVMDPFILAEQDKKRQLYALMTHNNIPWNIQKSALSVYPVVLETSSHDYNSIIEELPRFLQDQIRLHVKLKLIRKVPIFFGVGEDCLIAVAQVTVPEFYPQDENVIEYGESGSEMFFLEHGIVEIYTYNEEGAEVWMANLKGGSFFGEISLMSEDCRRTATVRAVTTSVMYTLTKESFDHVVSLYPDLKRKVEEQAKSRLDDIKLNLDGIERMKKATRMLPLQPRMDDTEAKKRWKRIVMQVILHRKKAMGIEETVEEVPKPSGDMGTAPTIGTFIEPINYHPQVRADEGTMAEYRRISTNGDSTGKRASSVRGVGSRYVIGTSAQF